MIRRVHKGFAPTLTLTLAPTLTLPLTLTLIRAAPVGARRGRGAHRLAGVPRGQSPC